VRTRWRGRPSIESFPDLTDATRRLERQQGIRRRRRRRVAALICNQIYIGVGVNWLKTWRLGGGANSAISVRNSDACILLHVNASSSLSSTFMLPNFEISSIFLFAPFQLSNHKNYPEVEKIWGRVVFSPLHQPRYEKKASICIISRK